MKRNILSLLLALGLSLSLIPWSLAAEGGAPPVLTVTLPETLPAVGETFTVAVSITGNPGLKAVQFTVESNSAAVQCTSAKIGSLLDGALSAVNPRSAEGAIIAGGSVKPIVGDGPVGVLTYQVVGAGDPGLRLKDIELTNVNLRSIDCGSAVVKKAAESAADTAIASEKDVGTAGDGMGGAAPPELTDPAGSQTQPKPPAQTPAETPEETLAETAGPTATLFSDVPPGYWARDFISQAVEKGLFNGYPDGTFHPDAPVTRIQLTAVLWRLAGRPAASQKAPFTDTGSLIEEFKQAADWGYEHGVITGFPEADGSLTLRPQNSVTRQQAVAIVFRYSGQSPGMEALLTGIYDGQYADSAEIAPYAKEALYWALYNRYLDSASPGTLAPGAPATRAQLAKLLVSYLNDKTG